MNRLDQQLSFVLEIDKLKTILRQTLLTDSSRREESVSKVCRRMVLSLSISRTNESC